MIFKFKTKKCNIQILLKILNLRHYHHNSFTYLIDLFNNRRDVVIPYYKNFIYIPLRVIDKSETYTEEVVEISFQYQEYVQDVKDCRIQVSGDGLTCMRARDAIRARADGVE